VALLRDEVYLVRPGGLVVQIGYTTWGWVHVIVGIAALLTGLGLLAGNIVARFVGVVLALLSAVLNVAFIRAQPVWSLIAITLDVIVIYAITVHGRELRSPTY